MLNCVTSANWSPPRDFFNPYWLIDTKTTPDYPEIAVPERIWFSLNEFYPKDYPLLIKIGSLFGITIFTDP